MTRLEEILAEQPKYRRKQIAAAWFDVNIKNYSDITTLPKDLRDKLQNFPWMSVKLKTMQASKVDQTWRALLELADGELVETVLMGRASKKEHSEENDSRFTICISSQVGCPMNCAFCATGRSGFKRNLSKDEIIDQVRFWIYFASSAEALAKADHSEYNKEPLKISNIVMMGQGEPLLNYDNVRDALNVILENTLIGPTKITVSTVGIPTAMDRMIEDQYFPPVRLAMSLHSAVDETRSKLIPSHTPDFFKFMIVWVKKYAERFSSKSHFIGFEYVMLDGINDDDKHLQALLKFLAKMGHLRINLIPYNSGADEFFQSSPEVIIKAWQARLMKAGFTCTVRHSQGQDIFAACGQLRNSV